jgi:hypothetical protein
VLKERAVQKSEICVAFVDRLVANRGVTTAIYWPGPNWPKSLSCEELRSVVAMDSAHTESVRISQFIRSLRNHQHLRIMTFSEKRAPGANRQEPVATERPGMAGNAELTQVSDLRAKMRAAADPPACRTSG